MHPKIEKYWNRLEHIKEYYDALIKTFTDEQLHFRPDDTSWSMMDVMHHLYTSERISLDFIKNFDFNRKNEKVGLKSFVSTMVLVNRLNSPKKFKAPKVVENAKEKMDLPESPHAFQHVWDDLRNEMKMQLEHFPEEKLNHFVFYQPVAGKENIKQALQFFHAHMRHHQYQIEAINHHADFPK